MPRKQDTTTEARNIVIGQPGSKLEIKAVWYADGASQDPEEAEGDGFMHITYMGLDADVELCSARLVTTWSQFLRAVAVESLKVSECGGPSDDWFDNAWKVM